MIFKSADTERERERERERQRETETDRESLDFLYIINVITLVKKVGLKAHSFGYNPTLKIFDH